MPNIWAHIQFGKEVLEEIGWHSRLNEIEWKTAFQLGCQGPDFLFYHHFLPWQPASPAERLGELLHNEQCGPFLLDLFAATADCPPEDATFAYTLGFLLHHVLDRHLHPFVFSLSGFKKWNHQRFETAMDTEIMRRRAGIDTSRTPVAPLIDTGGRLPGRWHERFHPLVARHYSALAEQVPPAMLGEAVAQMVSAQRLFFDPSGWKGKLLFGQLAPFSPPRRPPAYDVLNDGKRAWVDPVDRTVRHTESALELWDRALADGRDTARAGLLWLARTAGAAELRGRFAAAVGNVSYETGLPCGGTRITYAEPIL